jgi:hypothetical protein
LWIAVHATMTQITVICFDYISVFFNIVLFVLSFVKIWENGLTLQYKHFQMNDAMELYRHHPHMPGLQQIRDNDFVGF